MVKGVMTMMHEFLIELADLLKKHDASIEWDCDDCSDMHGIIGDKMVVKVGKDKLDFPGCWGIDAYEASSAID